ncbi:methyltransferase domain-containing protein [Glaciimonas sp. CA11.2]|uniref:methyltransferase domain-containing protein n=1 Tax=Glaciimonas sp. CA11.2 TaxID=3048601 RepID=UPI002AB41DA2|nr:methyltransferase domain-containing protein [Glaciimonas sp. CA11.2]MDY7547524.1 methyltransferase domain-containing protein [Glaciimonas sp. CA11.2]MEB0165103.1 methyltransferase domain-containing protein [Glaciimonas sp. CA11.2]
MDISKRSYQKELLDGDGIAFKDIEKTMQELDFINTWLGGHAISLSGLKQLLNNRKRVTICEIGCGGGDNLRVLSKYCKQRQIEVSVTGIDSNAYCIEVARGKWQGENAKWIHSDYQDVLFGEEKPDIIFSSLFCHHFTDEDLVFMLGWMRGKARVGWYINDLHRHRIAYYAIRWLTGWLSSSYLVKNDAPVSVLRGFTQRDWEKILFEAGADPYTIQWKWAFRWLIVSRTENER